MEKEGSSPIANPEEMLSDEQRAKTITNDSNALGNEFEKTETESKSEIQSKQDRMGVIVSAVIEFIKGNFIESRKWVDYLRIHRQLSDRGIIGKHEYPAGQEDLLERMSSFYAAKYCLANMGEPGKFTLADISDSVRAKSAFPDNITSYQVEAEIISDYDRRLSNGEITVRGIVGLDDFGKKQRAEYDAFVSDAETLDFMRDIAQLREVVKERKIAAEMERREREISKDVIGLKERIEKVDPRYQIRRQARISYQEKQASELMRKRFYESIQQSEVDFMEKTREILDRLDADKKPTGEEINLVERWINAHTEFGLEEMNDEEYYSFFADGRLYAHGSSFFGAIRENVNTPKFIEALKDGYLLGRGIGVKRGDYAFGEAFAEPNVSFHGPDKIVDSLAGSGSGLWSYAGESHPSEGNIPILLIAPAKLLEKYSMNLRQLKEEDSLGMSPREIAIGPGDSHFGSSDPDPNSRRHEIPLNLFAMLMPDQDLRGHQALAIAEKVFQNLIADPRLDEHKKRELTNIRAKYINSNPQFSISDFALTIITKLKEYECAVPRLFFVKIEDRPDYGKPEISFDDQITKKFLAEKHIEPSSGAEYTTESFSQNIPEKYRLPWWELNEITNRARKVIK